jgi:hypothetical protein
MGSLVRSDDRQDSRSGFEGIRGSVRIVTLGPDPSLPTPRERATRPPPNPPEDRPAGALRGFRWSCMSPSWVTRIYGRSFSAIYREPLLTSSIANSLLVGGTKGRELWPWRPVRSGMRFLHAKSQRLRSDALQADDHRTFERLRMISAKLVTVRARSGNRLPAGKPLDRRGRFATAVRDFDPDGD